MRNYPRTHLKAAAFLVVSLILIMALAPSELHEAKTQVPVSLALPLGDIDLTVATDPVIVDPLAINPNAPQAATTHKHTSFTVRRGDNLSTLFHRAGLTPQELYLVMSLGEDVSHLSKIQPGQTVTFTLDKTGQFSSRGPRPRLDPRPPNATLVAWHGVLCHQQLWLPTAATRSRMSPYA